MTSNEVEGAIKEYQTRQTSQYDGKRYDRLADGLIAEVLRLRAENAEMRGELVDRWRQDFLQNATYANDWLRPDSHDAYHSARQLHKLGLVEKHPDREAYRFVKDFPHA